MNSVHNAQRSATTLGSSPIFRRQQAPSLAHRHFEFATRAAGAYPFSHLRFSLCPHQIIHPRKHVPWLTKAACHTQHRRCTPSAKQTLCGIALAVVEAHMLQSVML